MAHGGGSAIRGGARPGRARRGAAGRERGCQWHMVVVPRLAARLGQAGHGEARRGLARRGMARVPMAHGGGSAICGLAWRGRAWRGEARQGEGI